MLKQAITKLENLQETQQKDNYKNFQANLAKTTQDLKISVVAMRGRGRPKGSRNKKDDKKEDKKDSNNDGNQNNSNQNQRQNNKKDDNNNTNPDKNDQSSSSSDEEEYKNL